MAQSFYKRSHSICNLQCCLKTLRHSLKRNQILSAASVSIASTKSTIRIFTYSPHIQGFKFLFRNNQLIQKFTHISNLPNERLYSCINFEKHNM